MTESIPVAGRDLGALAVEASFYGFPLVFDLNEVEPVRSVTGSGRCPRRRRTSSVTPDQLAGPRDHVRVGQQRHDLLDRQRRRRAAARCVSRCRTPAGRYYVLQFVDAWTNNFAYVGHRATGTEAGSFLLVGAGLGRARCRSGARVIRFPTSDRDDRRALGGATANRRPAGGRGAPGEPDGSRRPAPGRTGCPTRIRACPRSCASSSSCACGWRRSRRPSATGLPAAFRAARACSSADRPTRLGQRARRRSCATALSAAQGDSWRRRCKGDASPIAERLEPDLPRLRLQPRLLRGRRARR